MKARDIELGPWPVGINNVAPERSTVFSRRRENEPALIEAMNVDLDNKGWVSRRDGYSSVMSLVSPEGLYSVDNSLLVQDDGVLYSVELSTLNVEPVLETGHQPLSITEAIGQYWFINDQVRGRVVNNSVVFWGLNIPDSPTLTANTESGSLPAGTYMVTVTVEADGVESGAPVASKITLGETGSVIVSLDSVDANAEEVTIYCSDLNGKDLFWYSTEELGSLEWTITTTPSSIDPLDGFNEYPPPYGNIVRHYKGRMLVVDGSVLYWSEPLAYHRFKIQTSAQMFPRNITFLEPQTDGFYVADTETVWWVQGDDPESWALREVYKGKVFQQTPVRVPANAFDGLNYSGEALVWACDSGFVTGSPGGQIGFLDKENIALDTYESASLAFRNKGSVQQILLALNNQTDTNPRKIR